MLYHVIHKIYNSIPQYILCVLLFLMIRRVYNSIPHDTPTSSTLTKLAVATCISYYSFNTFYVDWHGILAADPLHARVPRGQAGDPDRQRPDVLHGLFQPPRGPPLPEGLGAG